MAHRWKSVRCRTELTRRTIVDKRRPQDADREWAYDRESPIGRLDKGLDESAARGWTVVDVKRDWKRVFAFEK